MACLDIVVANGSHRTKMISYTICVRTYVWIWSRDIDNDVSVASDVSTSGSDSRLSRSDVIKCDVTIWNSTKINPKWQSQSNCWNQKFDINHYVYSGPPLLATIKTYWYEITLYFVLDHEYSRIDFLIYFDFKQFCF